MTKVPIGIAIFTLFLVLSGDVKMASFSPDGGTLAVIIPTQAGLIVAADQRTTPDGIYCDGVKKIILPKEATPITVVITGLASFRDTSKIPRSELCNVMASTPAPVDFGRTASMYISSQSFGVDKLDLQGLAEVIYAEMKPFIDGGQFNIFFGTRLALINMADFEPDTAMTNIKSLAIELGPRGEFRLQPAYYRQIASTDRPEVMPFGEEPYFRENVLNGPGRKFLDGSYEQLKSKSHISEIDADLGSAVAINLIEATAKTTELIKPPSGIGGGLDCILLGLENRVFR
jgi:hypothetical protein